MKTHQSLVNSANSLEQFTALLHKQVRTGDLYYQTCVSTKGIAGEAKGIFKVIVACVWEATGFRFR